MANKSKLAVSILIAGVAISASASGPPVGVWVGDEHRTYISEWDLTLVKRYYGPKNSDAIQAKTWIEDVSGNVVASFPPLVGPLLFSRPNGQLLACEYTTVMSGQNIRIFEMSGQETFRIPHIGHLEECGLTAGGRLYWAQYVAGGALNLHTRLRIFDRNGSILFDKEFESATEFSFRHDGKEWAIDVLEPDIPG